MTIGGERWQWPKTETDLPVILLQSSDVDVPAYKLANDIEWQPEQIRMPYFNVEFPDIDVLKITFSEQQEEL